MSKLDKIPSVPLFIILKELDLFDLGKLSRVNKFFNENCKKIKTSFLDKDFNFDKDVLTPELFPEIHLPILNTTNYLVCSNAWKNLKF